MTAWIAALFVLAAPLTRTEEKIGSSARKRRDAKPTARKTPPQQQQKAKAKAKQKQKGKSRRGAPAQQEKPQEVPESGGF